MADYEYEAGTLNSIWEAFALKEDQVNDKLNLVDESTGEELRRDRKQEYYNLQPEGSQTGLVADATGVQYTGEMPVLASAEMLDGAANIYVEASKNSSAGDEEVTVEVYDVDAGAVADSFAITGGNDRSRSADISGSLTAGNEYRVRWNVTTASGTSGATFDAVAARLVAE